MGPRVESPDWARCETIHTVWFQSSEILNRHDDTIRLKDAYWSSKTRKWENDDHKSSGGVTFVWERDGSNLEGTGMVKNVLLLA